MKLHLLLLALFASMANAGAQQARRPAFTYPPVMEGARVETYKEVDGTKLNVWIFPPSGAEAKRPAIIFFFGGGWSSGSPAQFERQCRHFAARGMVAITADYRVATRQHVKPPQCVADAKSSIRWLRQNAERLGIDPQRIVAAGGSAGGHLAAATATLPDFDEPGEETKISAVPNALVLFNPALLFAPFKDVAPAGFASNVSEERFGCDPKSISPIHHIHEHLPPTLILHGRADTTVPFATVKAFATEMKQHGNRCELVGYEGQPHGFFNAARYDETLKEADKFLVSLGYLAPEKAKE
jgi:acetyl esterase/lipase